MAILVICQDSKDSADLREKYLAEHLTYIESILDQILIAGPNRAPTSITNHGSTFIYATDNLSEAELLFSKDPYMLNGVYSSYQFHTFIPAAGSWISGKIWN